MEFVQEGSDKEHSDETFATFVESFSGHEEAPGFHGAAASQESEGLVNCLRLRPCGLEDANASSPLAASTVSAATEDDVSSGTTENSSVSGEEEFANHGGACAWRSRFISESPSPKPPKRLRAAHMRLDGREDIKKIQVRLNEQPIIKGLVVPASNFSATEEEAFVKDTLYSPPRIQLDAAVRLGFSPTGFNESRRYTQRSCPVSGHLLKQLDDAELPFGAVMFKPEYDTAAAHLPEAGVVNSHLRDVAEGCLVAVPMSILLWQPHL